MFRNLSLKMFLILISIYIILMAFFTQTDCAPLIIKKVEIIYLSKSLREAGLGTLQLSFIVYIYNSYL